MKIGARAGWVVAAWVLAVVGSVAAQVHQGTPFVRKVEPPTRGDEFLQPRAVHADNHTGELFVSDTFNHRILIFDHRGFFRYQITGGSEFRSPIDVAVDDRGFLFVLALSGGRRGVVRMDFDGKILEHLPLKGLPERTFEPELVSIALSSSGDTLYALDQANQRLWIAGRSGVVASSVDLAADLTPEEVQEQRLGHVDAYGEAVLVAMPTRSKIWLFDPEGKSKGKIGIKGTAACQMAFPVAAALDADGKLLVLDKQRALFMRWDPENGKCLAEFSGFGNVPGALYQPGDLSLDDSGNIYVSQGFEGRVQVFRALATAPPLLEAIQLVPRDGLLGPGRSDEARAGLERQLTELEDANVAQRKEFGALERSQQEVQAALDVTRTELQELERWHALVVEALTVRLEEARASQMANTKALAETVAALVSAGETGTTLLTEIEALERRQRELEAEIESTRSKTEEYRERAEMMVSSLEAGLLESRIEVKVITAEREAVAANLEDANARNEELIALQDELTARQKELLTELESVREENSALIVRQRELFAELESARRALAESEAGAESAVPQELAEVPAERVEAPTEQAELGANEADEVAPAATEGAEDRAAAIEAAVRAWAVAWAGQRVDDYLGHYGAAFRPPDGLSRSDWEAVRRIRLTRPRSIEVLVDDFEVEVLNDYQARVAFDQTYRSDRFADKVRKTLLLAPEEGSWKIIVERVDSVY
ncbi:MAG: hypothetical protein GY769_25510 [bacterium]|nr:hypothetical protein [bacterium]